MRYKIKKKCIICGTEFEAYYPSGVTSPKKGLIRSKFSVTCSHQCSTIYNRVRQAVKAQITNKLKKGKA